MQCLLLADGKHSAHQNHVVILPGNGGSGMAAISFVGALKIPVSTRAREELREGPFALAGGRGRPVARHARGEQSGSRAARVRSPEQKPGPLAGSLGTEQGQSPAGLVLCLKFFEISCRDLEILKFHRQIGFSSSLKRPESLALPGRTALWLGASPLDPAPAGLPASPGGTGHRPCLALRGRGHLREFPALSCALGSTDLLSDRPVPLGRKVTDGAGTR